VIKSGYIDRNINFTVLVEIAGDEEFRQGQSSSPVVSVGRRE